VAVLPLPVNGGPAVARNAGFRAARHDLILFADNDVAIGPDTPALLATALAARPDALVAMPRIVHADRPDVVQYDGADCHFLGLMVLRHAEMPVGEAPIETIDTGSVVTCAFLVDRGRWRGGPPFDESFLFNYEDHDFGVRSRLLGHSLLSVPAAVCRHGGGTEGLSWRVGRDRSRLRVYCLMRNRWRIILQSYSMRTLVLLAPALLAFELTQLAGSIVKGWLGIWLTAAGWLATHPGETFAARRALQRARRTPDRDLLRAGPVPFAQGLVAGRAERLVGTALDRVTNLWWRVVRRLV
jgi:GT2 family glycosyltransferase